MIVARAVKRTSAATPSMLLRFSAAGAGMGHLSDLKLSLVRRTQHVHMNLHEGLAHLDRFFLRARLYHGEASDQFLRFNERPVGDNYSAFGRADLRAMRARQKSGGAEEGARFRRLFRVLADRRNELRIRRRAAFISPTGFGVWVSLNHHEVFHACSSFSSENHSFQETAV